MLLPAHAVQAVHLRVKSVSNEARFTLEVERDFRPIFPRIAEESLSSNTWYSLCIGNKQCKLR
jgi:hypothetical protein